MSVSPVQFEHGSLPVFKAAVAVNPTTAVWRLLFAALLWFQFGLGAVAVEDLRHFLAVSFADGAPTKPADGV